MSEHNHTEERRKLQLLEQSLHSILMQKQQFQAQLLEVESALSELDKTSSAYKIVGNIMVASKKEDLKKDLETKKEIFSTRMKAMEKQEKSFSEEVKSLREHILKEHKH